MMGIAVGASQDWRAALKVVLEEIQKMQGMGYYPSGGICMTSVYDHTVGAQIVVCTQTMVKEDPQVEQDPYRPLTGY